MTDLIKLAKISILIQLSEQAPPPHKDFVPTNLGAEPTRPPDENDPSWGFSQWEKEQAGSWRNDPEQELFNPNHPTDHRFRAMSFKAFEAAWFKYYTDISLWRSKRKELTERQWPLHYALERFHEIEELVKFT